MYQNKNSRRRIYYIPPVRNRRPTNTQDFCFTNLEDIRQYLIGHESIDKDPTPDSSQYDYDDWIIPTNTPNVFIVNIKAAYFTGSITDRPSKTIVNRHYEYLYTIIGETSNYFNVDVLHEHYDASEFNTHAIRQFVKGVSRGESIRSEVGLKIYEELRPTINKYMYV